MATYRVFYRGQDHEIMMIGPEYPVARFSGIGPIVAREIRDKYYRYNPTDTEIINIFELDNGEQVSVRKLNDYNNNNLTAYQILISKDRMTQDYITKTEARMLCILLTNKIITHEEAFIMILDGRIEDLRDRDNASNKQRQLRIINTD